MGWNNMDNNNNCPCKGCTDRFPACSDHCKKTEFLEWKAKKDKAKKENRRYQESFDVLSDAKKREIWRKSRYGKQKTYRRFDDR